MENSKSVYADEANNKSQADSGDIKTEMNRIEKLIDPGNEHSHHVDDEKNPGKNKEASDENEETGAEADAPPY